MNEQWQELKETIIEMRDNDGTGTQQEVCKFLANYMDTLEKQIQETRWIPISERLPEDKQQILISIAWDNKVYEVRQGDIDSINYFKHFKHITSIAWMPIPEPYRGEEAET